MNFDLADAIFWGIVIGYWVVGITRIPTYYRHFYRVHKDAYSSIHTEQDHQRSGAWHAMGLMFIWPYYEAILWARDTIIHRMTIEERKQAQLDEARKIIADYEAERFRDL